MIAHIFKGMGRSVGMTTTDGIYIDGRLVKRADASGPKSAQMVLQNPRVDFAVFETARGGILREGLGYGNNDVAVVLNVTGDHLGLKGIDTLEQLAAVKQVVVEAVPKTGWAVLNADDPLVAEHAQGVQRLGDPVLDAGRQRARRAMGASRREGGRAREGPRGEMMVIREGRRTMPIAWVHTLPSTFEGRARMMVQNAMAAAAAAHAAGAHLHDIRQGLRSFTTSIYQAPGRLNVFDLDGVEGADRLCAQRGRSRDARGLRRATDQRRAERRSSRARPRGARTSASRSCATAGDRRDEDMRELGARGRPVLRRRDHPGGSQHQRPQARGDRRASSSKGCGRRSGPAHVPGTWRSWSTRWRPRARRSIARAPAISSCSASTTRPRSTRSWRRRRSLAAPTIFAEGEGNGQVEPAGGDPDLLGV